MHNHHSQHISFNFLTVHKRAELTPTPTTDTHTHTPYIHSTGCSANDPWHHSWLGFMRPEKEAHKGKALECLRGIWPNELSSKCLLICSSLHAHTRVNTHTHTQCIRRFSSSIRWWWSSPPRCANRLALYCVTERASHGRTWSARVDNDDMY